MAKEDDIEYLLYKLIAEPKAKDKEEYYKYNDHPENYLGRNTRHPDSVATVQLQKTLQKLSAIIPILEMVDGNLQVPLHEGKLYLHEHGTKKARSASHKLRGMVKASVQTKKLQSLINDNAHRGGIVDKKGGCVFYISVPYNDLIRALKTG